MNADLKTVKAIKALSVYIRFDLCPIKAFDLDADNI